MSQTEEQIIRSLAELRALHNYPVEELYLSEDLHEVPQEIRKYSRTLRLLDLSNNQLTTLPNWFADLTSLEIVFLSFNKFSEVPEVLGQLPRLKMIGMRNNSIERLSGTSLPQSLTWLTLTNNSLDTVPPEIGRLPRLQKLLLAGNVLKSLPETLASNRSLELVRLSANRFESFPTWLFELPALAWIALAGNPCAQPKVPQNAQEISWNQLKLGIELGRGASGQTFKATLARVDGGFDDVAVKIFGASVSSDGDASDELFAALTAGAHPNIVSTRGKLTHHPDGREGLVLDLVPERFKNLACPPTFESCTRDVYSPGDRFSYDRLVSYATDIAAAAQHLHSRGVSHGDLYAHNTLVSPDSARISDFGAACVYDGNTALDAHLLERIEVRAFGILLRELLALATGDLKQEKLASLHLIADACDTPTVRDRPSFRDIAVMLEANKC